MGISLREFKEKFHNTLLDIHWRHWTSLGVGSHIPPERNWIIDLEPLIVSTLIIGQQDKRLLSSSIEWLIKNGEWINLSRLKRIVKAFSERVPELNEPLLNPELLGLFVDTYNKDARFKINFGKNVTPRKNDINDETKSFFRSFKIRNVTTGPKVQFPSLIQLLLRNIFGVDARTEILIYLLANESGNSNSISKEIFYNQRNVYTILERWSHVQMVAKISVRNISGYTLNRKEALFQAIGLKEMPKYINWTKTFLLFDQLSKALSTPPWSDDEYLLSSLFRDLFRDSSSIGRSLHVNIPEPSHFTGKQYFAPFASGILDIGKKLTRKS
jgi:hypothetical protein